MADVVNGVEAKLRSLLSVARIISPTGVPPFNEREFLVSVLISEALKEIKDGPEQNLSRCVENLLRNNGIRPTPWEGKAPRRRFTCFLCDKIKLQDLVHCFKHIAENRHTAAQEAEDKRITLENLPKPSEAHLAAVEHLLNNLDQKYGLSPQDLNIRSDICQRLNTLFANEIPGVSVVMFGSSVSGFGLKSSDVNLGLNFGDPTSGNTKLTDMMPHEALDMAFQILKEDKEFSDVKKDSMAILPKVVFNAGSVTCRLSLNYFNNNIQTTLLLKDYFNLDPRVKILATAVRYWSRLIKLDEQDSGLLSAHTFPILVIFFLQSGDDPVLPCLHDHLVAPDSEIYQSPTEFIKAFRSGNTKSAAQLWIEFLRFYAVEFQTSKAVVSIRRRGGIPKEETRWNGKKLTVEDPYNSKRPLTSCIVDSRNLDFLSECFCNALFYFGIPQTTHGPSFQRIVSPDVDDTKFGAMSDLVTLEEMESTVEPPTDPRSVMTLEAFQSEFGSALTVDQVQHVGRLLESDKLSFDFDRQPLTHGKNPIRSCMTCGKEEHNKKPCPDEAFLVQRPLIPMSDEQKDLLSKICLEVQLQREPTNEERDLREAILQQLTAFIRRTFDATTILSLFGSSCNGFALTGSDMDICMTFFGKDTKPEISEAQNLIIDLAKKLRKMPGGRYVLPIVTAKVPIVKFEFRPTSTVIVDCDICLYNTLALENTAMLQMYSQIDPRVKTLGYMAKEWAKVCDMCDASRGSLSSYAYILLMLHYLQRTEPPVIPVLQELYEGDEKPVKQVEQWNAWFFNKLDELPNVWDGWQKNNQSLADLWIGFLDYYAFKFDDRNQVVTIRRTKPLAKFEKQWMASNLAIEDPFELDHNLGGALTKRMYLFIKMAFVQSRDHFSKLDATLPINTLMDNLFNFKSLVVGKAPQDRNCRFCNKLGHFVRDCPKLANKENNNKNNNHVGPRNNQRPMAQQSPAKKHNSTQRENTKAESNGNNAPNAIKKEKSSQPKADTKTNGHVKGNGVEKGKDKTAHVQKSDQPKVKDKKAKNKSKPDTSNLSNGVNKMNAGSNPTQPEAHGSSTSKLSRSSQAKGNVNKKTKVMSVNEKDQGSNPVPFDRDSQVKDPDKQSSSFSSPAPVKAANQDSETSKKSVKKATKQPKKAKEAETPNKKPEKLKPQLSKSDSTKTSDESSNLSSQASSATPTRPSSGTSGTPSKPNQEKRRSEAAAKESQIKPLGKVVTSSPQDVSFDPASTASETKAKKKRKPRSKKKKDEATADVASEEKKN